MSFSTPVRRRLAAAFTVPLLLVGAAACGSDDDSASGGGDVPAVSGDAGKKPTIEKGEGDPPKKLQVETLKEGDGKVVKKGDVLQARYVGQLWNGKAFDSTWTKGRGPASFQVGTGNVIKGWDEGLVGKKLGSRVELVIPPEQGYGAQGRPPQIPANSTLVFVVDLDKTVPSKIDGEATGTTNPELPTVSDKVTDSAPSIEFEKGAKAPDELTSETLVEGDGKTVGADSTVLANFTAKTWKGQQLDDTWKAGGPQSLPVAQIPGWKDGLKDAKAGSRVVISVPGSEFPEEQQKQFGDGVVFAVDVLDVS